MLSEKLLFALNDADEKYLEEIRMLHTDAAAHAAKNKRRLSRTVLIAALIAVLFTVSAFAVGYFTMNGRKGEAGEKFRVEWSESPRGYLEWTDMKYIFRFTGPEECHGAQFKEGWLPFAPNEERNAWACDAEGWRTELVSEMAEGVDSTSENYQPYSVHLYYAPQFLNGGVLMLLDQTPGEIIEERWGDEQVMEFVATRHQDAIDNDEIGLHREEKDLHYYFVIRFHPDKGYILVVNGTSDMETVERVAREIQIRETEEIIRGSDFAMNGTFIDVGQG